MTPVRELYGAKTGNSLRAAIALTEANLPFHVHRVDLRGQEHRREQFLALNPVGKVPVLIDRTQEVPFVLTQSNAIMLYAAQQAPSVLLPEVGLQSAARNFERFFYFVTDVIAISHAAFVLRSKGQADAERVMQGKFLSALLMAERFVEHSPFMAGEAFSLADISAYTVVSSVGEVLPWSTLPHLESWYLRVRERPAVQAGMSAFDSH